MMRTLWAALLALALVLPGTPPARADGDPLVLTPADRADLARVEDYFKQMKTLKARFYQVSETGQHASGMFYLSRPDRMRLEYDPPIKDFIVADGWFVFFWDGELKQQSSEPIGSSLADVILRDNFRLTGDVTVVGIERSNGWFELSLVATRDPGKGQLTLVFQDKPLRLTKWRVLDAQKLTTDVSLSEVQINLPLDKNMFFFKAPEEGSGPRR